MSKIGQPRRPLVAPNKQQECIAMREMAMFCTARVALCQGLQGPPLWCQSRRERHRAPQKGACSCPVFAQDWVERGCAANVNQTLSLDRKGHDTECFRPRNTRDTGRPGLLGTRLGGPPRLGAARLVIGECWRSETLCLNAAWGPWPRPALTC